MAVGVAGSSAWATVSEQTLQVGQSARAGDRTVQLVSVERAGGGDRMAVSARLDVGRAGRTVTLLPQLTFYPGWQMTVSHPDIAGRLGGGDVYTSLMAVDDTGSAATVRVADNPLVGWLWLGGLLCAGGGAVCLLPARRRTPQPAPEAAAAAITERVWP
jgi:cytochrome c-type biogenesis protein CcmF